jgi:hypothetical protein
MEAGLHGKGPKKLNILFFSQQPMNIHEILNLGLGNLTKPNEDLK